MATNILKSFQPILLVSLAISVSSSPVWLNANGNSGNTYSLINSVLGGTAVESPDCAHTSYGPHITQMTDTELGHAVFNFHIHTNEDNDRCEKFDRQRIEIKTYGPSSDYLKGFSGDTVSYSWNVRLNSAFQPSSKFTHIHQIKAGDGDDSLPLLTISPRKKDSGNILEIIYTGRDGQATVVKSGTFSDFVGKWIHIVETITYQKAGKYSLKISRLDNGQELLSYSNSNIDMWRDGTTFVRPKWGIYRSIQEPSSLRDEHVYFEKFCLAKGSDKCT